jgi:hypothetical protein
VASERGRLPGNHSVVSLWAGLSSNTFDLTIYSAAPKVPGRKIQRIHSSLAKTFPVAQYRREKKGALSEHLAKKEKNEQFTKDEIFRGLKAPVSPGFSRTYKLLKLSSGRIFKRYAYS